MSVMENPVKEGAAIKNAALLLLSRREHSKYELRSKLARKFSDTEQVERLLIDLAENNLQSEERFIESFIRAKRALGKGPKYIKQELRHRGISEYLIASYVYEEDEDWLELAAEVYNKKFSDLPLSDVKEKARRIRFMVSRGFTPESVFHLLPN